MKTREGGGGRKAGGLEAWKVLCVCVCVCVQIGIHKSMHTRYIRTCMYVCMYVCMYSYTRTHQKGCVWPRVFLSNMGGDQRHPALMH